MEAKLYVSISDFFRSIQMELRQDFDFTIHSLDHLHGEPPTQSPFFRTNYHAFLLLTGGRGYYTIDHHRFELHAGAFYFTNPGHLKSFFIEDNLTGYLMTFSEAFLKANFPLPLENDFPFLFRETTPVMYLPPTIFGELQSSFDHLWREYQQHSPYQQRILGSLLVALLFKTNTLLQQYRARIETQGRAAAIGTAFRQLLHQNMLDFLQGRAPLLRTANDYAQQLHLHPNHLAQTIKSETGKTIKQWVDEKILAEAKTQLVHSDKTITEIAYDLGFSDRSNFARFFKKEVGQTPGHFRKS